MEHNHLLHAPVQKSHRTERVLPGAEQGARVHASLQVGQQRPAGAGSWGAPGPPAHTATPALRSRSRDNPSFVHVYTKNKMLSRLVATTDDTVAVVL